AVTGGMICLTHECRVLAARDIVFPNRKGRHSHFVLRSLVRDSVKTSTVAGSPGFLVAWRTHNELPGCKNNHFRALRAVAKDSTRLASRSLLSRSCRPGLVIDFADRIDQRLRLVKLDIFRAVAGEDLFGV